MSKKGTLTEKTGIVVFARIVNTIIDLAIVIAVVQILTKPEFAVIAFLFMVHEAARSLATAGFPESIFYFFERITKNARKAFVVQTIAILALLGILSGIIILCINYFIPVLLTDWSSNTLQNIQILLPLMALVTVLEVPTWPVTNILLASNLQKQASWYEMSTSLLSFVCVVVPLAAGYSLKSAIYGMVVYAVIRFLGSGIWLSVSLPARVEKNSDIPLSTQFLFSLPLALSALVGKLNRYIDKFIVSIILTATAFAEYTIAAQTIPIIKVIPLAVGSVLISRYVKLQLEQKKEELLELWYKGIEKVSLLVIPLTILIIVSASDFIALLAGSANTSYKNAVIPFQIYNIVMLLRVTHYSSILQALDDTKGVMYLSINLVIANIILVIPLTIYFGIIGAAFGTLIANLYNWYMYLHRIGGKLNISARQVLPFGFYLRVLGTAVIAAIPVWISRSLLFADDASVIGLVWNIVFFILLFGLLGATLKVITREDWNDLKNWVSLKFLR